jgi:hypothetical protein
MTMCVMTRRGLDGSFYQHPCHRRRAFRSTNQHGRNRRYTAVPDGALWAAVRAAAFPSSTSACQTKVPRAIPASQNSDKFWSHVGLLSTTSPYYGRGGRCVAQRFGDGSSRPNVRLAHASRRPLEWRTPPGQRGAKNQGVRVQRALLIHVRSAVLKQQQLATGPLGRPGSTP